MSNRQICYINSVKSLLLLYVYILLGRWKCLFEEWWQHPIKRYFVFIKLLIHCRNYSEKLPKIKGSKRNFCFKNVSLNFGNLFVSEISGNKSTLFQIVGKLEEVMLCFRKPSYHIKKHFIILTVYNHSRNSFMISLSLRRNIIHF